MEEQAGCIHRRSLFAVEEVSVEGQAALLVTLVLEEVWQHLA
jgi:hypothetical protein